MSDNTQLAEPEGVKFYSIRTGETHYGKLEPTIAAYLNSSDLGINASRGQDYGWRLHPDWVAKIKAFRKNPTSMSILTSKNGGQKPTLTQILYYIYGEQLQQYFESMEENENPYEEAYAQAIANGGFAKEDVSDKPELPAALQDFIATNDDDEDDITDLIDSEITDEQEPEAPVTPPAESEVAETAAQEQTTEPAKRTKK
jgi:hypothetical protein